MSQTVVAPRTRAKPKTGTKTQRPPLYKVILLNDDYTPREFVVEVLKAVFHMNAEHAWHVMDGAHQGCLRDRGLCPRRGRDQGEGGHRDGQAAGLSALLHHRAGRLNGRRGTCRLCRSPAPMCARPSPTNGLASSIVPATGLRFGTAGVLTARLNDLSPQAWLAHVLGCLNDHNIHNLDQLLPWHWKAQPAKLAA